MTQREEFEAWARDYLFNHDIKDEAWDAWQAAQAAQPVQVPEGWKLVPVEPTPEMLTTQGGSVWTRREIWNAMLSAAPSTKE